MRLIVSLLFYVLMFFRNPLMLFIRLMRWFLLLAGLATLCYMPLGYKEAMLRKMLALAFSGSFAFYMLGIGYDRIVLAVSRARFW